MSKKKEKDDFKWFAKAKTADGAPKEETKKPDQGLKEEKPDQKPTGKGKYPPLPNGLSSNRPH